jgi:hypothetical protein
LQQKTLAFEKVEWMSGGEVADLDVGSRIARHQAARI